MTLTEIMKACGIENEHHRNENPDYSSEHLQITNDLIKYLALQVRQLKIHVVRLEDVIYHGMSDVHLVIKPRSELGDRPEREKPKNG